MNLIDKKLRDKIKNTYELSISKKDTDQTTKKPIIEKSIDHTEYFKLFDKSGVILFDRIYSDFNLQWRNNLQKDNTTNLASSSINFHDKNNFNNKENIETESQKTSKINNSTRRNSNSNKQSNDNIGDRLYNDIYITKTKIETMRRLQEEDFKKMQIHKIPKAPKNTPKISKIKNYINTNNNTNNNTSNKIKNSSSQKNIQCSTFTFKPILNDKSLKIAKKINYIPNAKKKIPHSLSNLDITKENYMNLFKNKSTYKKLFPNKNKNKHPNNIKRLNEIYKKGLERIQSREKIYKENKEKKNEEYKKYSFTPKINKTSKYLNSNMIQRRIQKGNKKEQTIKKITEYEAMIDKKIYTFKPEITSLHIADDEKIINFNIEQMNNYIQKRRKFLREKEKKTLENDSSEKLIGYRPVIVPKELNNSGRKKSRSFSKERGRYFVSKGTVNFNMNKNDKKIYYYLNEDNEGDLSLNMIKNDKINNDISQYEFIDAVNYLHNQLEDLNI